MFSRIYNILTAFLDESKQGEYSKDIENYQFNCPCCKEENNGIPDGKYNLEILLSSTKGLKFHCWKCGDTDAMKGNIAYLIKRYGGKELYRQFKDELEAIHATHLYMIDNFDEIFGIKAEEILKLPETFTKINLKECLDNRVVNYLTQRHIDQNIIDKYNIGYTTWQEKDFSLRNRIIIPSYNEFGELNYWVGRDFMPPKPKGETDALPTEESLLGKGNSFTRAKYKNCKNDKKKIIFQESLINWDSSIILVEGAIDCLYFTGNAISLLGKILNKEMYLYNKIRKNAKGDVYIALDSDTTEKETKNIYKLLNVGRLKGHIWYIKMTDYKDFGESYEKQGKQAIINLIKKAKQFDEIDLMLD